MPFGDGTGPAGAGPRTGRGAGRCAGFGGAGRGRRNQFFATGLTGWQRAGVPPAADAGRAALEAQAGSLESALESIRKRLDDLEAKSKAQ